jgi:hypothetical protein
VRRGIAALGIVLVALAVAACGGSAHTTRSAVTRLERPSLPRVRVEVRQIMDRRLAKFGATKGQIGCVDHVIAISSRAQIVRRVEQGDAAHPLGPRKTPKQVAGALAGDCF